MRMNSIQIEDSSCSYIFFSQIKYFKKHMFKHFLNSSERWIDVVPLSQRDQFRKYLKNARTRKENWDQKEFQEAYKFFDEIVFLGVDTAINIPLYAISKNLVKRKKKNDRMYTFAQEKIWFVCRDGYLVIANYFDDEQGKNVKKVVVTTAYRPKKPNPADSDYRIFKSTYLMAKNKLQSKETINKETGEVNIVQEARFISKMNWATCPIVFGKKAGKI